MPCGQHFTTGGQGEELGEVISTAAERYTKTRTDPVSTKTVSGTLQ
jgi:hypothetical protein